MSRLPPVAAPSEVTAAMSTLGHIQRRLDKHSDDWKRWIVASLAEGIPGEQVQKGLFDADDANQQ